MKVMTERFGEIEINDEDIITFPKGILGFEEYHQYVLINPEENVPFTFMQSLEEETLCFLLLDTLTFFPNYEITLDDSITSSLNITRTEEVIVLSIVNAQNSLKKATTNLQAPIIINSRTKLGKQVVLDSANYLIKQPLYHENNKTELSTMRG